MAELTRRATTLIKDMLTADGKLPAYNEEVVRQTLQQISSHADGITQMLNEVSAARQLRRQQSQSQQQQHHGSEPTQQQGSEATLQQQGSEPTTQQQGSGTTTQQQQQPDDDDTVVDWAQSPEHAGAIVVHHETILKLKRVLLTYLKMRADCLRRARWQQRLLRADMKENMSPQELQFYQDYDRALQKYMAPGGEGCGMDLTLDLTPPKDASVRVMVLRDHGSIALSHSACVPLVKGSVHDLKCSEAEHLVRMGVLQVLDANV